jgi:hypothetical protein
MILNHDTLIIFHTYFLKYENIQNLKPLCKKYENFISHTNKFKLHFNVTCQVKRIIITNGISIMNYIIRMCYENFVN